MAQQLLTAFGGGIAAPSANRYGHVSPTRAEHVREEFGDVYAGVLMREHWLAALGGTASAAASTASWYPSRRRRPPGRDRAKAHGWRRSGAAGRRRAAS